MLKAFLAKRLEEMPAFFSVLGTYRTTAADVLHISNHSSL